MPDGRYFAERQLGHQHIYMSTVVTSDVHPDEVSHNHHGNGNINPIDESPGYTPPGGIVYLTSHYGSVHGLVQLSTLPIHMPIVPSEPEDTYLSSGAPINNTLPQDVYITSPKKPPRL